MQKSRAYRATKIKQVSLEHVLQDSPAGAVHVGLDVGKEEIYAVVRWSDGSFRRPWKALNPAEVDVLVETLRKISARHPLTAAMESTGTYGDVLRARLAHFSRSFGPRETAEFRLNSAETGWMSSRPRGNCVLVA
jgi:hypothetical protein